MGNSTRVGGMFYSGWWRRNGSSVLWTAHAFRAPFSKKGRVYSRPAVRGGRWKIRRRPDGPINKPWHAWSEGKAGKRWQRRFATHKEAVAWAHLVAETYRKFDDATANALLGRVLRYGGNDQEFISAKPED